MDWLSISENRALIAVIISGIGSTLSILVFFTGGPYKPFLEVLFGPRLQTVDNRGTWFSMTYWRTWFWLKGIAHRYSWRWLSDRF